MTGEMSPFDRVAIECCVRPRGASKIARTALTLIAALFLYPGRAEAMEHLPPLPEIEGSGPIGVLSATGFCETLAKYIESQNARAVFASDDSQAVLLVLPRAAANFKRTYASMRELQAQVGPYLRKSCEDGEARVYIYRLRTDGAVRRTFESAPSCLASGKSQEMYCVRQELAPGVVSIQLNPGSEAAGLATLAETYLMAPYEINVPDKHEEEATYDIWVDVGTEEAWVKVLVQLPGIDEASRVAAKFASVDSEGAFNKALEPNGLQRAALHSAAAGPTNTDVDRTIAFFQAKYLGHAEVKVLKKTGKFLLIQVVGLRAEVLPSQGYWEQLLVECVFAAESDKVDFFINTTGRYAPGVGPVLPTDESFMDMDRSFYQSLINYSNVLATELQNYLGG